MRIDIDGIIAAAVFLDREEEDLCRWELEAETLSFGIVDLSPAALAERCCQISRLQAEVGTLVDVSATIREGIDSRRGQFMHPDVRPAVDRQAGKAGHLDGRMKRLRVGLEDVAEHLGEIVHALWNETLDDTLIRIFGNIGEPMCERDMVTAVKDDRSSIASTLEAWRTIPSGAACENDRPTPAETEITQALLRLEGRKMAIRHSRMLRRPLWTVRMRVRSPIPSRVVSPSLQNDQVEHERLLNAA